jgi:hypothetical protein
MNAKRFFVYGLGFIIGLLCVVSIIILIIEPDSQNEPADLFEMSLEELMEIEITTVSQKDAKVIKIPLSEDIFNTDYPFNHSSIL